MSIRNGMIEFGYARRILLEKLEYHKEQIELHIENSTRKWKEFEEAVSQYKQCLMAADVLAGYIDIYGEKIEIKE